MAARTAQKVVKSGCHAAMAAFVEYETPKVVHIQSKKVGFINRFIQLAIIVYIAVYVIWWEKGYQDTDSAISATITKLKGIAVTNYTELNITGPGSNNGTRVWDVADYVIPPQENNAFFVMTNVIVTPRQTQDKCPEDPGLSHCKSNEDCPANTPVPNGNGIRTGECVHSAVNQSVKSCQIYAWCPVEVDKLPLENRALLDDSKNFTVLIKNYIEFPKFQRKRRNILNSQNTTYLQSCRYNTHNDADRLCPIFVIGDIIAEAQSDMPNASYDDVAVLGGVIAISIDWNCNLDYSIDSCLPKYSFSRLDEDSKIAKGSNFR